jgi:sterol desaturase/sphingolipid hydroxylase (fatty acid hydroxylase superfamily)
MKSFLKRSLKQWMTRWLYPSLLGSMGLLTYFSIERSWDFKLVYGAVSLALVAILILTERLFPLSESWGMTKRSFLRDLKYIIFVAPTISLVRAGFGVLAIHLSDRYDGPLKEAPFLVGLAGFLLVFELFQYWYHRLSHEGKGPAGRFLWNIHLAHHLPDRVYVVMHAVFHPLNAVAAASIIQLTTLALGVSPAVAFAGMLLIDLQSLVSHFNFDLRLGPLSYVFIGTETHRYHHSADAKEAGNYGNTLAVWDHVFGTFRYNPGVPPRRLGVERPEEYPASDEALLVLSYPLRQSDDLRAR